MREVFSLEDLFNVMIELESMGSVHYSNMKNMTDNSKLIVLFDKLSKQELAHKELYSRFKTEIVTFSSQKVDDEYKAYMDCLLTQTIGFLSENREVEDFEKGYRDILTRTANETNARLILCEPFVLPVPEDRKAWREDLDPKIHVVRQLAREFNAIYIPLDGIFAAASAKREPAFWAADGVHPTSAGHALIAMEWLKAIE